MRRKITESILVTVSCGLFVCYFVMIYEKGEIYPVPNYTAFGMYAVAAFLFLGLGFMGSAREIKEVVASGTILSRHSLDLVVTVLLFGFGLVYLHIVILAAMNEHPRMYPAYEHNTILLLCELSFLGFFSLFGLVNAVAKIRVSHGT